MPPPRATQGAGAVPGAVPGGAAHALRSLRSALPQAEVLTLEGVGHSLLSPTLIPAVLHWIETHAAGGHGQG